MKNAFYQNFLRGKWIVSHDLPAEGFQLGVFGKHPGWDDHMDDIGMKTPSLTMLKHTLYVEGIGSQINQGTWEKLDPSAVLEKFDHVFLWQGLHGYLVGRMWSSSDGKRRRSYPMVICAHVFRDSLPENLDRVFAALEEFEAACKETQTRTGVKRAYGHAESVLEQTLNETSLGAILASPGPEDAVPAEDESDLPPETGFQSERAIEREAPLYREDETEAAAADAGAGKACAKNAAPMAENDSANATSPASVGAAVEGETPPADIDEPQLDTAAPSRTRDNPSTGSRTREETAATRPLQPDDAGKAEKGSAEPDPAAWKAFLDAQEMSPDREGFIRALHFMYSNLEAFRPAAARKDRQWAPTAQQMRLPLCAETPGVSMKLWSHFVRSQLNPVSPVLIMHHLGCDWLDITVGEPGPEESFRLRAGPEEVTLLNRIPYRTPDELRDRFVEVLDAIAGGNALAKLIWDDEPKPDSGVFRHMKRWLGTNSP